MRKSDLALIVGALSFLAGMIVGMFATYKSTYDTGYRDGQIAYSKGHVTVEHKDTSYTIWKDKP